MDQSVKSTSQAYWYIIALEGSNYAEVPYQPILDEVEELSHAGGVVVRRPGDRMEYLLVQAKGTRKNGFFPKDTLSL